MMSPYTTRGLIAGVLSTNETIEGADDTGTERKGGGGRCTVSSLQTTDSVKLVTWKEGLRRFQDDEMDDALVPPLVDEVFVEDAVNGDPVVFVEVLVGAFDDAAFVDEAVNGISCDTLGVALLLYMLCDDHHDGTLAGCMATGGVDLESVDSAEKCFAAFIGK